MTALGELGLSSYEEKTYRTLLVTGAVTAAELSTASDVPKGRIYDVLNGLEARGLVRTQSSEPKRYVAVDPETAVDRLLAERTAELERAWHRYREVAETVRSDLAPAPPIDCSFWLGSLGSDEMSTALRQHVRAAEEYVRAAIGRPYENATWEALESEFEAFVEGTSADVAVELVASESVLEVLPDALPASLADRPGDVTVRSVSRVPLSFDVLDGDGLTFDVPHPVAADDRLGVVGLTDTEVVDAFDREFQRLWAAGDPVLE